MSKTISQKPLPVLPTELIGMIMEYRGSALYNELLLALAKSKKLKGYPTKKFMSEFIVRIPDNYDHSKMTAKEIYNIYKHPFVKDYLIPSKNSRHPINWRSIDLSF